MSHPIRRVTTIFVSLLLAVMSVNLSGVLSLNASAVAPIDQSNTQAKSQTIDLSQTHQDQTPVTPPAPQNTQLAQENNTPATATNVTTQDVIPCLPFGGELPCVPGPYLVSTPVKPTLAPAASQAPQFIDQCATADDSYSIPQVEGVQYFVKKGPNGTWHEKAPGTYSYNGSGIIKIKAVAKDGYVLTSEKNKWKHNFSDESCPKNPCATGPILLSRITSVPAPNDNACHADLQAHVNCAADNVAIYIVNSGGIDGIAFVDGRGKPITIPAYGHRSFMLPLIDFKRQLFAIDQNDNTFLNQPIDCTPGRGDTGGPTSPGTPSTPLNPAVPAITTSIQKPVTPPANIELPETGAHPFVQAFTLFIAGLTTYGAVFFLANRRNLASKK